MMGDTASVFFGCLSGGAGIKKLKRAREQLGVPGAARIIHYDRAQSACGCYTHEYAGVPCTLVYFEGASRRCDQRAVDVTCAACGKTWEFRP